MIGHFFLYFYYRFFFGFNMTVQIWPVSLCKPTKSLINGLHTRTCGQTFFAPQPNINLFCLRCGLSSDTQPFPELIQILFKQIADNTLVNKQGVLIATVSNLLAVL